MSLVENPIEKRLRAPFRISFFLVGMMIAWILAGAIRSALAGLAPNWITSPLSYIGTSVLFTVLVITTGRWLDSRPFSAFGIAKSRLWVHEYLVGIIIATLSSLFVFGVGLYVNLFEVVGFRPHSVQVTSWLPPLIGYLVVMLCVSYYEELVFRGYLSLNMYEGFHKKGSDTRISAIFTILLTSAFFAFVHANNPNATSLGVFNILLAGVMLGLPYFITGSLAMPIGIHFAWNFVQGPVFGLPVSGIQFPSSLFHTDFVGNPMYSGGPFGIEGGLLGTIAIGLVITGTLLFTRTYTAFFRVHPAIQTQSLQHPLNRL
jgi:uncharacterized protein